MASRDHTVPQLYLRRFAVQRGRGWFTNAARVDDPSNVWETNVANVASESGFYTFEDVDGETVRDLEGFFGQLESLATPALRTILDDSRWALTANWPLTPNLRVPLAWFMAAQIVRTTRQRKRLAALGEAPTLGLPGQMTLGDRATEHARFIASSIGVIAFTLNARPWALAHSNICLIASDCPVVILNAQDDDDQITATARDSIAFPLDPHRMLFLPALRMAEEDPAKQRDHKAALTGIGALFAEAVYDAADRHVFFHPEHHPVHKLDPSSRLPAPGESARGHGYTIEYQALRPDYSIEKRYAYEHVLANKPGGH